MQLVAPNQSPDAQRLAGKVAIVTGAGERPDVATGTGHATAVLLARHGAKVVVADLAPANAERTVATIHAHGGEAVPCIVDLGTNDGCAQVVAAALEAYGALHVLINNLGCPGSGNVVETDEDTLQRSLDINLKAATLCSKHAIPAMAAAGGGSIVNVSSIDGLVAGMHHNVSYSVAKGALHALTRTTAAYHGRDGIRANCIAPGHLYAAFTSRLPERTRNLRQRAAPLGTEGTAWDVAWAAVFLASDEARWISGTVLPVDGGLLTASPLTAYAYIEGFRF